MSKMDIIKKFLTVIQESQPAPAPDRSINDNYEPVDKEEENIMATSEEETVKELARNFAQALTERDFEHLDGRAEYYFYTVDYLIELIKNNDEQSTIKLFKENKIKSKYENCEFLSIIFSADREQAEVVYKIMTSLLNADDKYFKELNKKNSKKTRISQGTPFSTTYTLLVKKEKGTWKIDKVEVSEENIKITTSP
ncbi:hypothetical protein REC12_16245 [Desulfosporosinus sp. PR]|uniref:hypothetical protein n=1 Tax=Candidatus Desulfosporosinus nitrosoreducens TaxID=3401928 RepID=UPI00280011F3|nr:hypothetical protein [Desulfosporosinus sp. PR]MDQ7095149.1 hypothetical protein [Desulfosporosinus sp. PR]